MENVAKLGLELDTSRLRSGRDEAVRHFEDIKRKGVDLSNTLTNLQKAIQLVGVAFGALKLGGYVQETIDLAARYETLGVVLQTVGKGAGYSSLYLAGLQQTLMKTGISMIAARQTLNQFIQSQLSLTQASKLARAAQDAAVIAGANSSDTLLRIVHGIQSGNNEVLRSVGLNVTWIDSYKELARQLNKNVEQLTAQEKVQARVNAVMTASKPITGAYEAAMGTAGKQVYSMQRYIEDLRVNLGQLVLPVYTKAVFDFANALHWMNNHLATTAGIIAGGGLVAGILAITVALGALKAALLTLGLTTPAGWVLLAIAAAGTAVGFLAKKFFEANEEAVKATNAIKRFAEFTEHPGKFQHLTPEDRVKQYIQDRQSGKWKPPEVVDPTANMDPQDRAKELQKLKDQAAEIAKIRAETGLRADGRFNTADPVRAAAISMKSELAQYKAALDLNQNLTAEEKAKALAAYATLLKLKEQEAQLQRNLELQKEIRMQSRGPQVDQTQGNAALLAQAAVATSYGTTTGAQGILAGAQEQGLYAQSEANRLAKAQANAQKYVQIWLTAGQNIQNGLADLFERLFSWQFKNLEDLGRSLVSMVQKILAQIAAAYATAAISNVITKAVGLAAGALGGGPLVRGNLTASEGHHHGGYAGDMRNVRWVHPSYFTNAPRLHNGGIAGDEVPAILRRGERVLAKGESGGGDDRPTIHVHQRIDYNLSAVDGKSAADFIQANGGHIAGIVAQAAQDVPGYAAALRGR